MRVSPLFVAAFMVTSLCSTAPAIAAEAGSPWGASLGFAPIQGQYSTAMHFRAHPWGETSEGLLSLVTRSQTFSSDGAFVAESLGLAGTLGAQYTFLRAGLGLELSWVKRLALASGPSRSQSQIGFLVEPFVGIRLPVLDTRLAEPELRFHWPVYTTEPAFGPRVMLTLWLGTGETMNAAPRARGKRTDDGDEDIQQ